MTTILEKPRQDHSSAGETTAAGRKRPDRPARAPAGHKNSSEEFHQSLPPGTIDLNTLSKDHKIPRQTVHAWVKTGRLKPLGRLRGRGNRGGSIIVNEIEALQLAKNRLPRGRPKKQDNS